MKALLLEKPGSLQFADCPVPQSTHMEPLLRVTHCAVCRTDAKLSINGHRDLRLPRIPGHEVCAVMPSSTLEPKLLSSINDEQYALGFSRTRQDNRFVIWPGKACGSCFYCRNNQENLCIHMEILGFHRDGGFAEWLVAPIESLIPVPEGLESSLACFSEPLACTINALDQLEIGQGESIAVFGGGPLGLLMAAAAKERGALPTVIEKNPWKIERIRPFCRNFALIVTDKLSEAAFDTAVNATSAIDSITEGLFSLRCGGRICLFSGISAQDPISASFINEIHYRQITVTGAYGCKRDQMVKALDLLLRYQDFFSLLVEETIHLEQVPYVLPEILSGKRMKYVIDLT